MWNHLCSSVQLNLKNTLRNGQCFNWWQVDEIFIGVIGDGLIKLREKDEEIEYCCLNEKLQIKYSVQHGLVKSVLETYFRIDQNLDQLLVEWRKDSYFSDVSKTITGLRMVRQEPFECLISFVVSQNNNVKRITNNLKSIRETYGVKLGIIQFSIYINQGKYKDQDYYQFPSPGQLLAATQKEYQDMGLGYRARYLVDVVQLLTEKGNAEKYLLDLRNEKPDKILEELLKFNGVGRKVADCVSLFSMDCTHIVPVDTHVHQIFMNKQFLQHTQFVRYKNKTVVKKGKIDHDQVQQEFRDIFGDYAGWAHSYLFTAELPEFKEIIKDSKIKEKELLGEKNTKKKSEKKQKD